MSVRTDIAADRRGIQKIVIFPLFDTHFFNLTTVSIENWNYYRRVNPNRPWQISILYQASIPSIKHLCSNSLRIIL